MPQPHVPYQIPELAQQLEKLAGEEIAARVMAGSERITTTAKPEKAALWLKEAIDRLESLVDPATREQVLLSCGEHCALIHHAGSKASARRRKFATLEAFLAAEQEHPPFGSRLVWSGGNEVQQFYIPRTIKRPVRCYCGLLRRLPEDVNVSPTYCDCSRGFVQHIWQAIVGRPVQVELVGSCASGAAECQFVIRW